MSATTCTLCHWSGEKTDLVLRHIPLGPSDLVCPKCKMGGGVKYAVPELLCAKCTWTGLHSDLIGAIFCPMCGADAGPGCDVDLFKASTAPPPSILDAALAASSALDPVGASKPEKDLRVPTLEEREAERKRVAERIASMGRSGS
jgi:hypothetical protein